MPAEKNSIDERVGETIDDEAGQAVAFGMDQAIRVGDRVELEHVAAQRDRFADLAREERLVDRLVGIGGQHAQRDARMAVVEAAAGEIAFAVDDLDDAAGLRAARPASRPSSGRSRDASSGVRS